MTKRKRRRVQNKKPSTKRFPLLFFLICTIAFLVFWLFAPSTWNDQDRLTLVMGKESGEVLLVVFDPNTKVITSIVIPKTTQVEAAYQLGTWQLGSIWPLGQQEGLAGKLLANTIIKSFKLPIDSWASSQASGFIKGGVFSIIKSAVLPYQSSFTPKDRLKLAFFSLRVQSGDRVHLDLLNAGFLEKTKLISGEEGYSIRQKVPAKLVRLFAVRSISEARSRINIIDMTTSATVVSQIADVIEVMGSKVVSVETQKPQNTDCEVRPASSLTAHKIAQIFDCQLSKKAPSGNFDVELILGDNFIARF